MQTKLKSLLFERNISQYKLAEQMNMAPRTFSDKMRGKSDFTFTEVYELCKILQIENPLDIFISQKRKNEMR